MIDAAAPPLRSLRGSPGRLTSLVYEGIKLQLFDGELSPGDKLSVEALKERFGVSKQPVMEALRVLSADGLVEILPQIGSQVTRYRAREIQDFYAMFAEIEGTIAAAAAERRTAEQIEELRRVTEAMSRLIHEPPRAGQSPQYRKLNRRLHERIHSMADSVALADTAERMWDLSDFFIGVNSGSIRSERVISGRHDEHEDIRLAIEAGDADGARGLMREHIRKTAALFPEPDAG